MGKTVTYLDENHEEHEYEFDDGVEEVELVGDSNNPGYVLIGQKSGSNDVLRGVFDVVNEDEFSFDVPRGSSGESIAMENYDGGDEE